VTTSAKVVAIRELAEQRQDSEPVTEAKRRAARIKIKIDAAAQAIESIVPLIHEAIEHRDWEALGYADLGAYVAGEFGGSLARLAAALRVEVVHELTGAGMSTRAIGSVLDVSDATVRRDQAAATFVAPETITGLDGKTYPRPERPRRQQSNPRQYDGQNRPLSEAERDERNVAKLAEFYIGMLKESAPDLLALYHNHHNDEKVWDEVVWPTWKRRASLAEAIYKIASLAEDGVDLDLLLGAELRGPGKNLTPESVAAALDFLEKITEHLKTRV
jgi:hypothetical protein